MISVFQTFFILFVFFAVVSVVKRYSDRTLSARGLVFWILFWLMVAFLAIWPDSSQKIADIIGIGRGVDLVMYVSIAVVFFILFRLHIKLEQMKRDLTKVVRKNALEQVSKK